MTAALGACFVTFPEPYLQQGTWGHAVPCARGPHNTRGCMARGQGHVLLQQLSGACAWVIGTIFYFHANAAYACTFFSFTSQIGHQN